MAKYDDDDNMDDVPVRKTEKGPLDGMFADTNIAILVIFGCCCSGIALILSIVCLATNKDPKAKSNAMIVMIIGIIMSLIGCIGGFIQGFMQGMKGG